MRIAEPLWGLHLFQYAVRVRGSIIDGQGWPGAGVVRSPWPPSLRETGALGVLATKLGFKDRTQYESAVRRLLMDDEGALKLVRSLFGTLTAGIGVD